MPYPNRISNGALGYLAAVAGVGVVTGVSELSGVHANSTTAALALLLVVLVVATLFGSRPALLASILGVLSFNFFFLPPYYTWHIAAPENWVAFAAFLITAGIAGQLSSYARRRADESEERRKEIETLYRDLQSAFEQASHAEALQQSEKLKSALLDAVTHDLRTPLTSIKASVTTLLEDARSDGESTEHAIDLDTEERNEFLEIINEETDRLNEFIGGMVDLAKIEAGKLDLRKARTPVHEIVREAIVRARVRLKNHNIKVQIADDVPDVWVDAPSVAEVIYTLLDNAAKYSPKDTDIVVRATLGETGMLRFSVDDSGSGIKRELRERVFEKFFRASGDIHATAASGLGLGLSIARGIVESQGGSIRVEDGTDGSITRFVFQIPIGTDEPAR